jgi:D-lactate dehydrogenase
MRVLFYSTKKFEIPYLIKANHTHIDVQFTEDPLSAQTAHLAKGIDCVSIFTADDASTEVIRGLHVFGVKYIAIRAAGFDNIDLKEANDLGIRVANVPEYSPYSIAEHAVALILALNRKLVLANQQVKDHNFTLDNLIGFDLHGKTVGIIGTGRIGKIVASILHGFGCNLLGYDIHHSEELQKQFNVTYCSLRELCINSDIVTVHTPLNEQTRYMLDKEVFSCMKKGIMIINTARGAVVNTQDLISYIENGTIGAYGMDVYEKERGVFFIDRSTNKVKDPMLSKLMDLRNVLITPHQAFATNEALTNIADTTFYNILEWQAGLQPENELSHAIHLISAMAS